MVLRSFRLALAAAAFVFGIASCGDSPTAPGGGNTMTITAVSPESPVAATAPQTLTVRGGNFQTGFSVFVREPDGAERVFSGGAIQQVQSSSFQVTVVLPQAGVHELRLGASPAAQSPPFQLMVRATGTAPVIFSVTPSSVVRGSVLQPLHFTGLSFDTNLRLTLTAPDGVVTVLTGPQLSAVTPTGVDTSLILAEPGVHTFVITNPSGESSNPVTVNVL